MFRGEEIKPLGKHLPLVYSTLTTAAALTPDGQMGNCPSLGDIYSQIN